MRSTDEANASRLPGFGHQQQAMVAPRLVGRRKDADVSREMHQAVAPALGQIDASEENCGNLSRCAQQIADRGRHREQRGVLTDKTGDLQPQRQAVDREQR